MKSKYKIAALVVSILALLVFGFFLRFKVVVHSDILYFNAFWQSIAADPGQYTSWRMTPAPVFFPDLALYGLAREFTSNVKEQIFAVSFVQWLLLMAGATWIARGLKNRWRIEGWTIFVAFLAATTAVMFGSDYWLFFHQNNLHFGAMLMPVLQIGVIFNLFYRARTILRRTTHLVLYFLIALFAAVSDPVYLIMWVIPSTLVFAVVGTFAFKTYKRNSIDVASLGLVGLIGAFAGYFIQKRVVFNDPLLNRVGASKTEIVNSFSVFLDSLKHLWASPNYLKTAGVAFLIFAIIWMSIRLFRASRLFAEPSDIEMSKRSTVFQLTFSRRNALLGSFALTSLVLSLFGAILTSGFRDVYGYRYITLGLFLVALWVATDVITWLSLKIRIATFIAISLSVCMFAIALAGLIPNTKAVSGLQRLGLGVSFPTEARNPFTLGFDLPVPNEFGVQKVTDCAVTLKESGVPLERGAAQYWYARTMEAQSNYTLAVSPFLRDFTPFFWINSRSDFENNGMAFNWAVIEPDAASPFDFTGNAMGQFAPEPTAKYDCGDGYQIWYWDNLSFDRMISTHVNDWENAPWLYKG